MQLFHESNKTLWEHIFGRGCTKRIWSLLWYEGYVGSAVVLHINDFSKGVNSWLSWKFKIWSFFGFGQHIPRINVCWCSRAKESLSRLRRTSILQSRHINDFSKGGNSWLSWKFKIWSFFGFGQHIPRINVCWCSRAKESLSKLRRTSILQSRHINNFSKGVNSWLSWKFKIWSFFGFGQHIPRINVCWCSRAKESLSRL